MRKWLLLLSLLLFSCAVKRPFIVPPYVVNKKIDIFTLKNNWKDYYVYYSGPIYNPSAVCFVIKDKSSKIKLHKNWKQIKDIKDFNDILSRIEYLKPYLYVIIPDNQILGYIYTTDHTFLRKTSEDKYYLLDVREQFNDIYYGGDDEFDFQQRP